MPRSARNYKMIQEEFPENQMPYDYLKNNIGKGVKVNCRQDVELKGKLRAFDFHQNLFLSDVTETSKSGQRSFEVLFVRGDQLITLENDDNN